MSSGSYLGCQVFRAASSMLYTSCLMFMGLSYALMRFFTYSASPTCLPFSWIVVVLSVFALVAENA